MRASVLPAVVLAMLASATTTHAQERAVVVVVDDAADTARARAWKRRIERAIDAEPTTLTAWSNALSPVDTVEPDALAVIVQIEELLVSARAAAARLEERHAQAELTRAEELARRHLTIPGIATWYAEVQLAMALAAAQAGQTGLAEAALRRAASVDPSRVVQAAEARPDLVERSRAAVRATITGPRGRFEVSADAEGARVFLDDRPLGALPRVVEAPVGPHVLRVDAPGHRGWAQIVEVLEGERAPIAVRLSPSRARVGAAHVEAAARQGRVRGVDDALRGLAEHAPPAVWLVWAGAGGHDRAVAVRCTSEGCEAPRQLEGERAGLDAAARAAELGEALAWMDEAPSVVVAHEEWWERWYIWAIAGAVLAGGVSAAVVAAQPQGPAQLRLTVDPSRLPLP